ncbi:MAG: thioesterase family protein [Acidimicrobiales bacterium]
MTVERSAPPTNLVELLELEQLAAGLFLGRSAARGRERVYGGQVVAQALTAARSTVPDDHKVHSLHGYFIRAGDETVPIVFDVDLIRDGRSFTTRRVVARQPGGAIFNLSCSFHRDEPDVEFSRAVADLAVPPPDECIHEEWDDISDVRTVPGTEPGRAIAWIRNALPDRLPDDPWVHTAAMVYASDHIPMDAVWSGNTEAQGYGEGTHMGASLDHSVWIHRESRADEWQLYDMRLQSLQGSRGVAHGTVHSADGVLIATVAQEGLLRRIRQV